VKSITIRIQDSEAALLASVVADYKTDFPLRASTVAWVAFSEGLAIIAARHGIKPPPPAAGADTTNTAEKKVK